MISLPASASLKIDDVVTASYMANFENILAEGKEPSMTKEYKPQVACTFEKYLNPQQLKQYVLRSDKMQQIIAHYAHETNTPSKQVERQVNKLLDEIGLDRSLTIIRWCGMAITRIGKRISSGIYVNAKSMAKVKSGLGHNPVLYLPSHRSYMDFILMSYICFHYDIEIPGIAAGMDFHAMFAMGTMLRKTGAFFMRRSFSNDELYWDVFREYMYALVSVYHIGVEFFIEGTRSRNFKALVPKVGLLSMALLPYFTGEVSDVTIVPVSVSYERLLEEQLFVYELLGVPKPKESTKGFFKALKIIDERFGKMYLDFGDPISVREFFGHTSVDRLKRAIDGSQLQKLNTSEIELIKKLANEIIYQQQRRIVITTFNLLSLCFATHVYTQQSVNIDELARCVLQLKHIFEELGAHVATNQNSIKPEIIETVEIHSNIIHFQKSRLQFTQVSDQKLSQQIGISKLKAHTLNQQVISIAIPVLSLQLYINPCMFWMARLAYLLLAALQAQQEEQHKQSQSSDRRDYPALVAYLTERVAILDDIFKHEFVIRSNRETEEFERNLNILETHDILRISEHSGQLVVHKNECSRLILSALAPFLCMYYQLAVVLNQFPFNTEFTSKEVLIRMQQHIEELLLQQKHKNISHKLHVHPYCLALDNLNIALYSLIQAGYLTKSTQTADTLQCSSAKRLHTLEQLLRDYCDLLPFTHYYDVSNLQSQQFSSSKL